MTRAAAIAEALRLRAEREALGARLRAEREARAAWGFRAALAAARGEAIPARPARRTRAEERAALLAADRATAAAWVRVARLPAPASRLPVDSFPPPASRRRLPEE